MEQVPVTSTYDNLKKEFLEKNIGFLNEMKKFSSDGLMYQYVKNSLNKEKNLTPQERTNLKNLLKLYEQISLIAKQQEIFINSYQNSGFSTQTLNEFNTVSHDIKTYAKLYKGFGFDKINKLIPAQILQEIQVKNNQATLSSELIKPIQFTARYELLGKDLIDPAKIKTETKLENSEVFYIGAKAGNEAINRILETDNPKNLLKTTYKTYNVISMPEISTKDIQNNLKNIVLPQGWTIKKKNGLLEQYKKAVNGEHLFSISDQNGNNVFSIQIKNHDINIKNMNRGKQTNSEWTTKVNVITSIEKQMNDFLSKPSLPEKDTSIPIVNKAIEEVPANATQQDDMKAETPTAVDLDTSKTIVRSQMVGLPSKTPPPKPPPLTAEQREGMLLRAKESVLRRSKAAQVREVKNEDNKKNSTPHNKL